MFKDLSEVTYEAFGINPAEFYKNKFNAVPHHDYFADPVNNYLLGASRVRFLCSQLSGGSVLDLGCGGGPYGMTLKENKKADFLVGIDLDPDCVKRAGEHYDKVMTFEALTKLPFPDNSFDAVFSSDFFGHIEFRYKDALIQEIFRVLRPGGKTIHLIESADYDYLNCNASDPEDPLRKYVHVDGHIGVESPENIKKRFSAFSNIHMRNAMLFPFFTVQGFINNESVFGKEYTDLLRKFSPQEAQAADIVSGFICDYLEKALAAENPANLDPTLERNLPKVFRYGCGMVFLTAEKKLDNVNE